jgi:HlyD family secretion protein
MAADNMADNMTALAHSPNVGIRKLNLLGCTALVLAVGGFGGWASTTEIAGAVIATGSVVVESNVKKVQHLNGGIVGEILVKEGSVVEPDQVLMRLDDTLTRANLGVVQSQLDLYVAREARLMTERDGLTNIALLHGATADAKRETAEAAIAGERKLFQSRREGLEGQRAQLRERVAQTTEEIRGLTAQQHSKEGEIGYVGEELSSVSDLYAKNLVSLARLKQLQRDQARLQGERGQLIADVARSRAKIAETQLQILQLDQDFRTEVLKDLRETQAKIAELQERANAASDELRRTELRAPQAGVVYQLQVHTIGGVIGKGETVMQIAPRAEPLIVEAKVAPQDIDQVEIGAPVRIRIDAGNRRTTPELNGRVTVLSPDLAHDQSAPPTGLPNQPYYLARVNLAEADLKSIGDLQLVPGMPVEVYIRTQDRTPLDYLLKPLREQIARTFRER